MLGRLMRKKRKLPEETGWLNPRELKDRTLQRNAQVAEDTPGPDDIFHAPTPAAQVAKSRRLQRQNAQFFPIQSATAATLSWQDSPPQLQKRHASWPSLAMPPCRHGNIYHLGHLPTYHISHMFMYYVFFFTSFPCLQCHDIKHRIVGPRVQAGPRAQGPHHVQKHAQKRCQGAFGSLEPPGPRG